MFLYLFYKRLCTWVGWTYTILETFTYFTFLLVYVQWLFYVIC